MNKGLLKRSSQSFSNTTTWPALFDNSTCVSPPSEQKSSILTDLRLQSNNICFSLLCSVSITTDGFRKVMHIDTGVVKQERDGPVEFQHPYFKHGQDDLLENIKRKARCCSSEKEEISQSQVFHCCKQCQFYSDGWYWCYSWCRCQIHDLKRAK